MLWIQIPNTLNLDLDPEFWLNMDPDTEFWLNLDQDQEFWLNLDPDPGLPVCYQF